MRLTTVALLAAVLVTAAPTAVVFAGDSVSHSSKASATAYCPKKREKVAFTPVKHPKKICPKTGKPL